MTGQAVTFDFHNTLARCPEWFELEVRTLPSAFLRWWGGSSPRAAGPEMLSEADTRYRELRREIIEHGNELTAEECLQVVFSGLNVAVPSADIAAGVEHLMRDAFSGVSPVPGAIDAVRTIDRSGVPLGIVSSAVYHPFLEWTLDLFGIRGAMRAVVTSASAGYYKSRPELYWHAAKRLDAHPDRMVHVGDSYRFDVAGARKAGLGTVWLRHEAREEEASSSPPDLTLSTLEASAPQILTLLRQRVESASGPSDFA
jgi:FMN phosphatase YigB (HAD superfamily)